MNSNLLSATRRMQNLMQELCEADVHILAARIDMDYNTPRPHTFRFHIHAWNDANFACWAVQYHTTENVQRHETTVPFLDGQVFTLND